jgi:hypothetical protein
VNCGPGHLNEVNSTVRRVQDPEVSRDASLFFPPLTLLAEPTEMSMLPASSSLSCWIFDPIEAVGGILMRCRCLEGCVSGFRVIDA